MVFEMVVDLLADLDHVFLAGGFHTACGVDSVSPHVVAKFAFAYDSCDDGACSPTGRRSFFLTESTHAGATAGAACGAGFHVASIYEILDPSNLYYDESRGWDGPGSGPPFTPGGWVYGGDAHCSDYTTTTGLGHTAVMLWNSDNVGWS